MSIKKYIINNISNIKTIKDKILIEVISDKNPEKISLLLQDKNKQNLIYGKVYYIEKNEQIKIGDQVIFFEQNGIYFQYNDITLGLFNKTDVLLYGL